MRVIKIKRGIVGSYNLLKIMIQRLKQLISEHANDNIIHHPAAGRFELDKIIENIDSISLPHKEVGERKIKVCILAGAFNFWAALETICKAFEQDSKYDVCILISEDAYVQTKPFLEENYFHRKCCREKEYGFETERPDILLFSFPSKPNAQICLKYRYKFKLVIAIVAELITYSPPNSDHLRSYRAYRPDYYIADPLFYGYLVEQHQISREIIALNNAKYDEIYDGINKIAYSSDAQWNKLKDKKTILWGTTHGVDAGATISYFVTFDLYAKSFFDYARQHPNVGFIIRLHPTFVQEMRRHGFWTLGDLARLKEYCRQSPNIVWDENATYNRAYSVADGILTDGYCGMIVSALPLMKPICACYRFDYDAEQAHKDYVRHLYQAHSIKDMCAFFDMVAAGKDPMYEERKKIKEKYINNFDGKNGQRIKEFIEKKFFEEACG